MHFFYVFVRIFVLGAHVLMLVIVLVIVRSKFLMFFFSLVREDCEITVSAITLEVVKILKADFVLLIFVGRDMFQEGIYLQ